MNSRRKALEASWARTRAHLGNAFSQLPPSPADGEEGGSIERYLDFLDHNELELALDELAMLGEVNEVNENFWRFLLQAADEMTLGERAEGFRKKLGR